MICKNRGCKHHDTGTNRCKIVRKVKLGTSGQCESFEKGLLYYFDLVYDALRDTNMILPRSLTMDMRIGLYYVMKTFRLGFSECDAGPWMGRFFMLKQGEDKKGLKTDDIIKLPLDHEAFEKIVADFNKGILPGPEVEDEDEPEPPKKKSQPFGWLSPTGEFTEGDFAEHEKVAYDIIKAKGFHHEFRRESIHDTSRDFLAKEKGYVLIHNPTGYGGYIVSHEKPLTKKQRDFLYGYFIDMGDSLMANKYIAEQED